jgi:hypothetical protein
MEPLHVQLAFRRAIRFVQTVFLVHPSPPELARESTPVKGRLPLSERLISKPDCPEFWRSELLGNFKVSLGLASRASASLRCHKGAWPVPSVCTSSR